MALAYSEADPQLQQQQLKIVECLTQRLRDLVNNLLFLTHLDGRMLDIHSQPFPLDTSLIEVREKNEQMSGKKVFLSCYISMIPKEKY